MSKFRNVLTRFSVTPHAPNVNHLKYVVESASVQNTSGGFKFIQKRVDDIWIISEAFLNRGVLTFIKRYLLILFSFRSHQAISGKICGTQVRKPSNFPSVSSFRSIFIYWNLSSYLRCNCSLVEFKAFTIS